MISKGNGKPSFPSLEALIVVSPSASVHSIHYIIRSHSLENTTNQKHMILKQTIDHLSVQWLSVSFYIAPAGHQHHLWVCPGTLVAPLAGLLRRVARQGGSLFKGRSHQLADHDWRTISRCSTGLSAFRSTSVGAYHQWLGGARAFVLGFANSHLPPSGKQLL